jgi:hypothetical protein
LPLRPFCHEVLVTGISFSHEKRRPKGRRPVSNKVFRSGPVEAESRAIQTGTPAKLHP